MEEFIQALEKNIVCENWYGAIFLALTLPDICGKLEYPGMPSTKRYPEWFNRYVQPKYTNQHHTFLSGNDCYALRCALLHEGVEEIGAQRAQDALDSFHFTIPRGSGLVHMNQKGRILQLQIDEFSKDIIDGIRQWLLDVESDASKQVELGKLMKVYDSFNF